MKVMKMRGNSTYSVRVTGLRSSSVDRICSKGRDRDLLKVGLAVGDSSEVGSVGRDSSEMGLTDSVEVEGILHIHLKTVANGALGRVQESDEAPELQAVREGASGVRIRRFLCG
jgi:hypothetical protein